MKYLISILLFCIIYETAIAQQGNFREQLIGWGVANFDDPTLTQFGLRYMPDFYSDTKLGENLSFTANISFNAYANTLLKDFRDTESDLRIKPYRLQFGLETNQLDLRVGLQKINFGSASLIRPLMWFDKIDPRDPLQLTDGVYSFLARYYFLNNANIWFWTLLGNSDQKGWEIFKSNDKIPELGGRVQLPLFKGEVAATYHYREGTFNESFMDTLTNQDGFCENRYALDGKFDFGIGLWFEAALIHQKLDFTNLRYKQLINIGADYTFNIGNGLSIITEYFTYMQTKELFGNGDGLEFIASSISYPINIINNIQAFVYYDITNNDYYRFVNFSWTYDNWMIYIMGYWNPENYQIYQNIGDANLYSGYGAQLMIVFNH